MRKPAPPYLRLIEPPETKKAITDYDFSSPHAQGTLFASQHPSLVIFAQFDELSEADLIALLIASNPQLVFDARFVPRFDVGSINRRLMFSLFQKVGAKYFDVVGASGKPVEPKERADGEFLASCLVSQAMKKGQGPFGPLLVLIDDRQRGEEFLRAFVFQLDRIEKTGWEVMRVPEAQTSPVDDKRTALFISHATPNDNEFARWLATHLQLLGYDVWVDFDRLVGGELFWEEIENVIRAKAAKVLIVASALAQSKNGVLDEINLAVSVERASGIENFVIPLRIDELPYDQFRVNISRKNVIDFSRNWAAGFAALLKVLERDRVTRFAPNELSTLAKSMHARVIGSDAVDKSSETLLLNWLEIISIPTVINFYTSRSTRAVKLDENSILPHVSYSDGVISFADPIVVEEHSPSRSMVKRNAAVLTTEFMKGQPPEFPEMKRGEARKILSNLIRQGWHQKARQAGLNPYQLASGAIAWFAPDGLVPGNVSHFVDEDGKKRRKALVGFSAKRQVYWHFAVEVRLAPGHPLRLVARPHVVFSEDGRTPLRSIGRLHALRRGFCKVWWNDRWRDLLVGYMAWLGDQDGILALNMGCQELLLVSARFMTAVSPVSIAQDRNLAEEGQQFNEEPDVDLTEDELCALDETSHTSGALANDDEI